MMADPVLLAAGDFVLMPGGKACRLYNAAPIDAFRFFSMVPAGATAVLNGGGDVSGLAAMQAFLARPPEVCFPQKKSGL